MRKRTCDVLSKVLLRDSNSKLIQFLMKLNNDYESVRSQILAMDPLPTVNKAYYIVQQNEKQKQEGHTIDQCFEKIGYPDWYKGKKSKKQGRMAANVSSGFDDHFSVDTPFDMGYENEI
ncbi:hypothetical protein Tco_0272544 [Tanacetum coccineum]